MEGEGLLSQEGRGPPRVAEARAWSFDCRLIECRQTQAWGSSEGQTDRKVVTQPTPVIVV